MCGNYFSHVLTAAFQSGSPPRVRELLSMFLLVVSEIGITPACAGITPCAFS